MLKGPVTWYTSLLLRKAGDTQLNDLDPGVSSVHFCNLHKNFPKSIRLAFFALQ